MKTSWIALSVSTLVVLGGCANQDIRQAEAAGAPDLEAASTFLEALATDVEGVESKVVGLAEALTAEQYNWRPGDGVLSAGEVFMHIAAYNYYYPSLAGAEIPAGVGVTSDYGTVSTFEASRTDRGEIIAAVTASFEHLGEAVGRASGADLDAEVMVFGSPSSAQEAWYGTMTHLHEHLGQLIAYARTNGVVPPWSM